MKNIKRLVLKNFAMALAAVALASALPSCARKKSSARNEGSSDDSVQKWHVTNERVIVLFGYGYNGKDFVSRVTSKLFKKYGSADDGGLILALVFPDDFKKGKDSIAWELPSRAEKDGAQIKGIVTVGAPENTSYGLAKIQDSRDGERCFPIFSFFPQDDALGMEAVCDFVVDKAQPTNIDGEAEEESASAIDPGAEGMIERSVEYIDALSSALPWDSDLMSRVKKIAGDREIARYVDAETGLRAVNHFTLK